MKTLALTSLMAPLLFCATVFSQATGHNHADHAHQHGDAAGKPFEPPKIYLDKSLRIVQYQLGRLDNARLLLVERKTDDPKYTPVFTAILTRAGMSPQHREEALHGLVQLNKSNATAELLTALKTVDPDDRQEQRTGRRLAAMLLGQDEAMLVAQAGALRAATTSESRLLRSVGYAGLIAAGQDEAARKTAFSKPSSTQDWLAAVPLAPIARRDSPLRDSIVDLLGDSHPATVRRAAIETLAHVPLEQAETFRLVAPFVYDESFRTSAVQTLLKLPQKERDAKTSAELVDSLVKLAESTPAAKRTTDEFLSAMQLVDQLLARIPVAASRSYRDRLREVTVRVVLIHTVEEEMRYDTPFFAVEADRPVQIVLKNEDLMPHNLVVTLPGALKEVAELGLAAGPTGGVDGKQYVPKSEKVLYATGMVDSGTQHRLTFTAPTEPGEYPFVCTFPRHWMRMYGVMVVVEDLDAWLKDPVKPKDPIGSNRSFVQAWTLNDFKDELDSGLRGRSPEIGQRLFTEALCAQCHKIKGQGGAVGPELTDAFKRWKGDRLAVLREVLDPSHRIDPKYAVHFIITSQGRTFTGIVKEEDKTSISLLVNPEAKEPTVIKRADIDESIKTSTSMMPKALLDRYTKDEIFELMAFLESVGTQSSAAHSPGGKSNGDHSHAPSSPKK